MDLHTVNLVMNVATAKLTYANVKWKVFHYTQTYIHTHAYKDNTYIHTGKQRHRHMETQAYRDTDTDL